MLLIIKSAVHTNERRFLMRYYFSVNAIFTPMIVNKEPCKALIFREILGLLRKKRPTPSAKKLTSAKITNA